MTKQRREYIPPAKPDICEYCGNDGSNVITCDSCRPRAYAVQKLRGAIQRALDEDEDAL